MQIGNDINNLDHLGLTLLEQDYRTEFTWRSIKRDLIEAVAFLGFIVFTVAALYAAAAFIAN
jgi:hypothetical protein